MRDLLAFEEAVLGPEHPTTLQSMWILARIRLSRGDLRKPETCEVLDSRTRTLGEHHPDTLKAEKTLLMAYKRSESVCRHAL